MRGLFAVAGVIVFMGALIASIYYDPRSVAKREVSLEERKAECRREGGVVIKDFATVEPRFVCVVQGVKVGIE